MTQSHCIKHVQCPECARNGNDRTGNNLAVYSDGSCWCFSCGYLVTSSGYQKLKSLKEQSSRDQQPPKRTVSLPTDVDFDLPQVAREWIKQYELTDRDMNENRLMWSESWQRLIFPYFDPNGLLAWQGRYLGIDKTKPKWYSDGLLHEFVHTVGNVNSKIAVLTEDIVSAIKVGHQSVCAIPIFGSHVSTKQLLRICRFYGTIIYWLDFDKAKEATKFAHNARQFGVKSFTVITEKDPKEYTDKEIKLWLESKTSQENTTEPL